MAFWLYAHVNYSAETTIRKRQYTTYNIYGWKEKSRDNSIANTIAKYMSQKLAFKWLGPYRIYNTIEEKGTYILEEQDGSRLAGIFTGDRLKKFHPR